MTNVILSLLLAATILLILYHDFPFSRISNTLCHGMRWQWVAATMVCGALAQITRGLRWKLLLAPLNCHCHKRNLVGAVFMSFALSLLIPRIGELSRCATIRRTDGISFVKNLGTVFTERIVDTLILLLFIGIVAIWQCDKISDMVCSVQTTRQENPSASHHMVTVLIVIAIIIVAVVVAHRLHLWSHLKPQWNKFKQGMLSVRSMRSPTLFIVLSVLICAFNFGNLWLMFYAFPFTAQLGPDAASLAYCMITFAMLVPTPNGAGPWHYVVQMSLAAYGVGTIHAATFALITHGIHVLTIILLGLTGMLMIRKAGHSAHT